MQISFANYHSISKPLHFDETPTSRALKNRDSFKYEAKTTGITKSGNSY